jgi:hypothetical protein
MDGELLERARAYHDEQEQIRLRQIGEFEVTLATPNLDECNRAAANEVVMLKQWDLSPVDPQSFDPTEPPGRPTPPPSPPANTVAPNVTGTPELASTLTCSPGTWIDATSQGYQWLRGATNVAGATGPTRMLAAADVGAMMYCRVTATGPGGSTPVVSNTVGPVVDPGAGDEEVEGAGGETVQPHRARQRRTT